MTPYLIEVTPELGVLLIESLPTRERTTVRGLLSGAGTGTMRFDGHGMLHVVRTLRRTESFSLLERLLAATVHNPWTVAEIEYESPIGYTLAELQAKLLAALKADNDILTQVLERAKIQRALERSKDFSDLVGVLKQAKVAELRVIEGVLTTN